MLNDPSIYSVFYFGIEISTTLLCFFSLAGFRGCFRVLELIMVLGFC